MKVFVALGFYCVLVYGEKVLGFYVYRSRRLAFLVRFGYQVLRDFTFLGLFLMFFLGRGGSSGFFFGFWVFIYVVQRFRVIQVIRT